MRVTVIIATYNEPEWLEKVLWGYSVQTNEDFELIIADDGSGKETFAQGIRNTVGFTWHPETGDLWLTDNGRDMLGDDLPPDELNVASRPGMHFGYPYCHGGDFPDPEFGAGRDCDEFVPPARKLGPHVAALGVKTSLRGLVAVGVSLADEDPQEGDVVVVAGHRSAV